MIPAGIQREQKALSGSMESILLPCPTALAVQGAFSTLQNAVSFAASLRTPGDVSCF